MGKKLPRCKVGRCKQIARVAGYCKTHATKKADKLFSAQVRGILEDGTTEAKCIGQTRYWVGASFPCSGALQCCHLFSRRYRNIRWHYLNAVPGCAAHHLWMDTHPIEKDEMMLEWLEMDYEMLRDMALDDTIDWRLKLEEVLNAG